jgi:hypothetical protein
MNPDLSQLRDIHMPEQVSWWPPAIGWWLLLAIMLLAIFAFRFGHRRRKRNAWRRTALDALQQLRGQYQSDSLAPQRIVSELSVLMRRVAISRFPREEAAQLSGEAWLEFLDRNRREGVAFKTELGRLLVVAPYAQQTSITADEMNKLFALCENWIAKLSAQPSAGGQS